MTEEEQENYDRLKRVVYDVRSSLNSLAFLRTPENTPMHLALMDEAVNGVKDLL